MHAYTHTHTHTHTRGELIVGMVIPNINCNWNTIWETADPSHRGGKGLPRFVFGFKCKEIL